MQPTQMQSTGDPDLLERYLSVRGYTEELCSPLEVEDYIPQPVVDVSPVRWNIAHTSWFFEEMILKRFLEGYEEFDQQYGFLFNSYYESIGERTERHKRGDLSRPTVAEIFRYRSHIDTHLQHLLESGVSKEVSDLIVLGLNHEQQHQELLLTDLKYTFSVNPVKPVYRDGFALVERGTPQQEDFVPVQGGRYRIGFEGTGFCFDNELARHEVLLDDFEICKGLVTNGEFAEFIDDGGYDAPALWHSDGWDWVNRNRIRSPLYWNKFDGQWHQYTLGGMRRVDPEHAVCHISFYEASAFAAWKGLRLPTEFEWEAASAEFEWGIRWEWTNSAYLPYPGFKIADGAVGEYNGKFMVNQMVLRGASVATPAGHSRRTYRNFFQPDLRWQYTGIRLAK